jgi:hypothetical protein
MSTNLESPSDIFFLKTRGTRYILELMENFLTLEKAKDGEAHEDQGKEMILCLEKLKIWRQYAFR